jgi:hypothetical protein
MGTPPGRSDYSWAFANRIKTDNKELQDYWRRPHDPASVHLVDPGAKEGVTDFNYYSAPNSRLLIRRGSQSSPSSNMGM